MYESVRSSRPAARSDWDVHLYDDGLTYVKEPCAADDVEHSFFLHVVPEDDGDLAAERQPAGFDTLDFRFSQRGAAFEGRCMVSADLPEYEVDYIRTGQLAAGSETWSVDYNFALPDILDTVQELLRSGRDPDIKASFNVYLVDGRLIYVKESCSTDDRDLPFFLHVIPSDEMYLTDGSEESGFDNLGFELMQKGGEHDGNCFAVVDLPGYDIASISTGQFDDDAQIWKEDYNFALPEILDAVRELLQSGREPVIRSSFDVYLDEGRLVYVKDSCNADDRNLPFFLHVVPADASDLPDGREETGFDNHDFDLMQKGGEHDGLCFAAVDLPHYDIASIRTGQWVHGEDNVWEASIEFEE